MSRKFFNLILAGCLALLFLTGCSSAGKSPATTPATKEDVSIRIGCMKGPTAIGMIRLLSESDAGNASNTYEYTVAGAADELSAALIKGELDIASVPCNLASVLYHKTEGQIVTAAINTLGVLYIVEGGNTIESTADLAGKTIYSTGQGTTPEYTLRYLLTCAGLDPDKDVTIEYKSEASEVVAALAKDPTATAMLPQPYVTAAMNNNPDLRIALDITEEWESLAGNTVVTGVIVARKSFIEEHPAAFADFLKEYQASAEYANSNIDDTAALLENYDIFKAAIAKKAIPYCNVVYIAGTEMKESAMAYLKVLFDQNPAAVGGSLEEGMFYIEE